MRTGLFENLSILALSLLTAGCQYKAEVSVTGSANHLMIDVRDHSVPNSARGIGYAILSENIGGKQKSLWQIDAKDGCAKTVSHLVYGETPLNFTAHTPPRDLIEGIDYEVIVGGCGYNGKAFFRLVKGQAVSIDRPTYDR